MKPIIAVVLALLLVIAFLSRKNYLLNENQRFGWTIANGVYHQLFIQEDEGFLETYLDGRLIEKRAKPSSHD